MPLIGGTGQMDPTDTTCVNNDIRRDLQMFSTHKLVAARWDR